MCGIVGFYLNRPLNENDIIKGEIALNSQSHRGPDNRGLWHIKEKGIFLGHNRLSIIDLKKTANQPMIEKGSAISYNGEIYNYNELKEKYFNERTHFISNSDTEVLLKLWKLKGEKCLTELDGMFAFAIFEENKLSLTVDPFGEKPLYYHQNNDGIYFASEISSLLKMCSCELREDEDLHSEFLLFGYINSPFTAYKDVFKIAPSKIVQFKKENNFFHKTEKIYWDKPSRQFYNKKSRPVTAKQKKELKELIIKSIESRLVSDVPIGLFLSSGIDSTLIASIAKFELNKNIKCFTVKFDKNLVHDESESSKKIANYLGLEHEILLNKEEIPYSIENLNHLYSMDLNDNPTIFSYYKMSKLASQQVKVALSGLGGDELFLGYNRYNFFNKYLSSIQALNKIKTLLNFQGNLFTGLSSKLSKLDDNFLNVPQNQFYLRYKNLNQGELFNQNSIKLIDKIFKKSEKSFFNQILEYDINQTMPCSYIPPTDLGGMKASLEIRSPFLNKDIYEYLALNFNQKDILYSGGKQVLKDILSTYIPTNLISNKKQGFVFPIDELIPKNNLNYIGKRVLLRRSILNHYSSIN